MEYYKTEIRTGIVVLICLILVVLLTVGISGTKTMGKTQEITVLFKNIGGMSKDAPVNFAGFEVGTVKELRITTKKERVDDPLYNIAVRLVINSQAEVKEDSLIQIRTLGYLGLKYIDITPGTPESRIIKSNEVVLGYTPQDVNDIIDFVGKTVQEWKPKIDKMLDGISTLVDEEGVITETLEELKDLVNNADELIVVNKEKIQSIITNLDSTSANLKEFSEDVKDHPWKLLLKTKENREDPKKKKEDISVETKTRISFSSAK